MAAAILAPLSKTILGCHGSITPVTAAFDWAHQPSSRGPSHTPIAVGISIPSRYQVATNGAASSGQCKVYMSAPMDPAANPLAAPAQRSRVGARSFRIHRNERKSGVETNAI